MLIDSHCHLDHPKFDADRYEIIRQLVSQQITAVIVPAVSAQNWQGVLSLANGDGRRVEKKTERDADLTVYPALGIHPWFVETAQWHELDQLDQLLQLHRNHVVALGECGLDFVNADTPDKQRRQLDFFNAQLHLAQQHDLPVILHHRNSHDRILQLLRREKLARGGVIHAFSGSYQQAYQYIDLGFKLGIGGTITYVRSTKTRGVVAKVPLTSLVLETDAPDMPLYGRQGQRNSPIFLPDILKVLVELRPESAAVVAQQLFSSTCQLFGLIAE